MADLLGAAKTLLESIRKFEKAGEGDSNDAEIDAGIEMKHAARAVLREVADQNPSLADLIDSFENEGYSPRLRMLKRVFPSFIISEPNGDVCGEIFINGEEFSIPANPPQFLVVERNEYVVPLWAFFTESLVSAKADIEASGTEGVESIRVYDLDSTAVYEPKMVVDLFTAVI